MQGSTLLTLPGLQCMLPQAPSDALLHSLPHLGCCGRSTTFMPRILDPLLPPVQGRQLPSTVVMQVKLLLTGGGGLPAGQHILFQG